MSDPVALALIAMVGGVLANIVLTWKAAATAKEAKEAARLAAERAEIVKAVVVDRKTDAKATD